MTNYYDKTTVDEKIDAIPKPDLTNYLTKTGDGSNLTAAFEEATTLDELTTGEKLSSILGKIKLAVKNLKSLIELIGTTDISTIGDGTITGGLSDVNGKLSGLKFASISTSVTLLVTNRQSLLGSLSDFGLPSNANVFGVFVNCNWAVNVRLAINGNFYAYQIATVSNDATFTLNFVVAYK